MKSMLIAVGMAACAGAAFGGTTTAFLEDFEGAAQWTSATAEFSDGAGDFWGNSANVTWGTFVEYIDADGAYFAGMDLDGEGASLPITQTFDTFSIADLTDLTVSVDLAEDQDGLGLGGGLLLLQALLDGDVLALERVEVLQQEQVDRLGLDHEVLQLGVDVGGLDALLAHLLRLLGGEEADEALGQGVVLHGVDLTAERAREGVVAGDQGADRVLQAGLLAEHVLELGLLDVERLAEVSEDAPDVVFDRVLMIGDGGDVKVGDPTVEGAQVNGVLVRPIRGRKVTVFKMKRRKGYRRKNGHRQDLHQVKIKDIQA